MSARTFRGSDGNVWTAWYVCPDVVQTVPGTPPDWLAFQTEDGAERRRLLPVPEGWDALPDDRLDLLRRMAEPVTPVRPHHSLFGAVSRADGK